MPDASYCEQIINEWEQIINESRQKNELLSLHISGAVRLIKDIIQMHESRPHLTVISLQSEHIEQLKNKIKKNSWDMSMGGNPYPVIYNYVINQGRILSTMLNFMHSILTLIHPANMLNEEPRKLNTILREIRNFIQDSRDLKDTGVRDIQEHKRSGSPDVIHCLFFERGKGKGQHGERQSYRENQAKYNIRPGSPLGKRCTFSG